jgi:hypothetical protein
MNANTSVTANFTASSSGGTTTLHIDDSATTTSGYCGADGSRQNSYTGADGGYYINLSNSSGKGVNWSVNAAAAGTYNLQWRYANAGSQSATTARVLVNGVQAVASVAFPTTSTWSTWTTTALTPVTLAAGANTIRLETTVSSEFANIDWIEITGNNPTAAACTSSRISTVSSGDGDNDVSMLNKEPILVPNPTTSVSLLRFGVTGYDKVVANMYTIDGRFIKTIVSSTYAPGTYSVNVDYTGLQAGVYFISVHYGGKQKVLQSVLLK